MSKAEGLRKQLRKALKSKQTLVMPGAFNAICAKFVEAHGYPLTYISGSATSGGALALPDIGLMTLEEQCLQAKRTCDSVNIPVIADADTGFGELINIPRCIHSFEDAGVAGVHIEDQVFPKRCGHLDGKDVVSQDDMCAKIKRACENRKDENFVIIARSDACSVHGFDNMLDRLKAYVDSGADMVFPEALHRLEDFEKVCNCIDVPVLANMTEFGKTPFFSVEDYAKVGVKIVMFPVSLMRVAMGAIDRALKELKQTGHQGNLCDDMFSRQDFYKLIDYDSYQA